MKLCIALTVTSVLLTVSVVHGNSPYSYPQRNVNHRRTNADGSPYFIPEFIRRTFGGNDNNNGRNIERRRSARIPVVSRRFQRHPANIGNIPGEGFSQSTITTARIIRQTNAPGRKRVTLVRRTSAPRTPVAKTVLPVVDSPLIPAASQIVLTPQKSPANQIFLATPPESLEGWLTQPKIPTAPSVRPTQRFKPEKKAVCGAPTIYGYKCDTPMDQCRTDSDCPGNIPCCNVATCGRLCAKFKPSIEEPKKKWTGASSVLKRQKVAENARVESSTTATGLKIDDIAST